LNALTTDQVVAIETADIVALTTAQVAALTSTQLNALTTEQVQAIETRDIVALTTAQVAAIETADLVALTTAQVAALTSTQLNALTTDQVQAIETADIVALTTAQVAALTSTQLNALTTDQVQAIETADIAALTTAQVAALGTTQVLALTTAQYAVLQTADIAALTTSVIATVDVDSSLSALTTAQLTVLVSPIVLDLNGDGISTLSYSSGVQFDLHASGQKVQTGWAAATDGLLVLDRNQDGMINDGSELFGTSTTLVNGEKAKDGYVALSELDSNGDGSISKDDAKWADLKVWVDKNSDGISEAGEMVTLDSLGITQLDLAAQATSVIDNGNVIGLTSSYQTADGTNHAMADVWFVADRNSAATAAEVSQSLPAQVGGLTQAITDYVAANSAANAPLSSSLPSVPGSATVGGNVSGLASVLSQFDVNGNLIANPIQPSGSQSAAGIGQALVPNQDPSKTGFLAS
jgi:hypothetical protein